MLGVDDVPDEIIGAVVFSLISVPIFIAFLNQRKKPGFKTPATICLVSSLVGTGLAWLAFVTSKYEEEPSFIPLKVMVLGGVLICSPICLLPKWFMDWVIRTLKLQPREHRVLFRIGKTDIWFGDILRVIVLMIYGWILIAIWSLAPI